MMVYIGLLHGLLVRLTYNITAVSNQWPSGIVKLFFTKLSLL